MISKLKEIVKEYTQGFPEPLTLDELKRLNYEFEKIEELNICFRIVVQYFTFFLCSVTFP